MTTLKEILNMYGHGAYFNAMMVATADLKFPYPKDDRGRILHQLEQMDIDTTDVLDELIKNPNRMITSFKSLSTDQLYILKQRYLCGLEILTRMTEAAPSFEWIRVEKHDVATELQFLLTGLWKEFGILFHGQLAWRLFHGHAE